MHSHQEATPPSMESVLGKNKIPESMEIVMAKLLRKNPVIQTGDVQTKNTFSRNIAATLVAITALVGLSIFLTYHFKPKTQAPPKHEDGFLNGVTAPLLVHEQDVKIAVDAKRGVALSADDKGYYSSEDSLKSVKRVFNFPTDVRIGTVGNSDITGTPAVGRLAMRVNMLRFGPTATAINSPQYLSRFRPGEVTQLIFSGEEMDLADMSNEKDSDDINPCCRAITFLPHWQSLRMLSLLHLTNTLSPASIKILQSLHSLQGLDVYGQASDTKNIAQMPFMKTLTNIHIALMQDYLSLFRALKNAHSLRSITIDRGNFTDDEIKALCEIPGNFQLNIEFAGLNAADIVKLSRVKKINNLTLEYKLLSDPDALKSMKLLTSLNYVRFLNVPRIAMPRLPLVRKALPGVTVIFTQLDDINAN